MPAHRPTRIRARSESTLRSARGAFDLPSIITGVVVVGVLTAGVLATIFGIIPFAQENGAKQDLAAVRTAEGVALAKDGRFMTTDELFAAGYLTGEFTTAQGAAEDKAAGFERAALVIPERSIAVQVGPNKDCYVGVSRANTGRVFFSTDQSAEAKLLEPATVTGCIDKDTLVGLTDAIGATTPEMKLPPADVIKAGATPTTFYQAQFSDRTVLEGTTVNTLYEFTLQGFNNVTSHDVTWAGTSLKTINATGFTPGASGTRFFVNVHADPKGLVPGTGYVTATIKNKATGETTVKSWKLTVVPKTLAAAGDYRYTGLWTDRSMPAMTSTPVRFTGALTAPTSTPIPSGRYTAVWSGAEAFNAAITASELANTSYQERLFIADVVPKTGGLKAGSGVITLTLTNTLTGAVQSRDFKLTVTPQADAAMPAVTYAALEQYGQRLTFSLPSATAGDFTTRWSLEGGINATVAASDTGPSVFSGIITPTAGGLYPGTAKATATFKHVASGQEYKRTWDVTVLPISWAALGDKSSYEMGTSPVTFQFEIARASYNPGNFEVTWKGGTALNSTATPVAPTQSGATLTWGLKVAGSTGGFLPGTDTVTVTARHIPTGTTVTKTMSHMVRPVQLREPSTGNAWTDRTVAASAKTVIFGVGVDSSFPAANYTISWSGLEGANVTGAPAAMQYYAGVNNYMNTFSPKAGGFTPGVHTLTATLTNKFSGAQTVKTWKLTVTP